MPVRNLTFALKTRIGSSDSVVQARMPSTAYAISASTNFFLIVTQVPGFKVSKFQGTQVRARFTLKPCNLETLKPSLLVHRGGFEPPYLLRGTDLQSVGFNRSPTCANPENRSYGQNKTHLRRRQFAARKTKCGISRLTPTLAGNYLMECVITVAPLARVAAQTAVFPEIILWSWRRDLNP